MHQAITASLVVYFVTTPVYIYKQSTKYSINIFFTQTQKSQSSNLVLFSAPPSYEECFGGRTAITEDDDSENTSDAKQWAPAYTYYSWDTNPPAQQLPSNPNYEGPSDKPAASSTTYDNKAYEGLFEL